MILLLASINFFNYINIKLNYPIEFNHLLNLFGKLNDEGEKL